jgi:hypothetical protein
MIGVVVIILVTCGMCCTGKTTYGPEEYYGRSDGTVGYGAKSYNSNSDKLGLMLVVGIPVAVLLMIASVVFQALGEDRRPKTTRLAKVVSTRSCPVCNTKASVMASVCHECDYPFK